MDDTDSDASDDSGSARDDPLSEDAPSAPEEDRLLGFLDSKRRPRINSRTDKNKQ